MEKLFENQGTLALFLFFFVLGFITLKVYDLLIPGEQRDFSKSLFDAVAYSSLNFAAFFWLIAIVRSGKLAPWQWYSGTFFLLIVMPAIWPFLYLRIRKLPLVAERFGSPNVSAWDEVFAKRTECWVIVRLKDQRQIGGFYGPRSFASRSPAPLAIYIEEVWQVDADGGFTGRMMGSSSGIFIMGSEILAVEFFRYNWVEALDVRQR
jgi:hypothetical protein